MTILQSDIIEICEFLDNMGDGQNDELGKTCKKYSNTLRKLITLIF